MRKAGVLSSMLVLGLGLAGCSDSETPNPATRTSVPDELPAALDNGAAGRDTFNPTTHIPPSRACGDRLRASKQSLVVRVLPDGPRTADGQLAFTSGVCVYLPPGYARSALRYPVIYLLHGGGGDAGDAVAQGRLRETMDEAIAADPDAAAIVVMPDGTNAQWYDSLGGRIQSERYVTGAVVPYVDQRFRTIAERRGRAVVGISNGGYGAMLFAAKHPQQFVAAGGMSSNLDGLTFPGLGPPTGAYYRANHPIELVEKLAHTDVILNIASRCTNPDPAALCATQAVDQAFLGSNRNFVAALRAERGWEADLDYEEVDGAHQWSSWGRQLRDRQLPFLLARLRNPSPG